MDIRYAIHPDHLKSLDTDATRRHFLVERLFEEDRVNLVYSHIDRIIVGGVCPVEETLRLEVTKGLGVEYFLQRREMGIINIGSQGAVFVDGTEYLLAKREGLYIGMGCKGVSFKSSDAKRSCEILLQQHSRPCCIPCSQSLEEQCPASPARYPGKGKHKNHQSAGPSKRPEELPACDGDDRAGTKQCLEHHAKPHS